MQLKSIKAYHARCTRGRKRLAQHILYPYVRWIASLRLYLRIQIGVINAVRLLSVSLRVWVYFSVAASAALRPQFFFSEYVFAPFWTNEWIEWMNEWIIFVYFDSEFMEENLAKMAKEIFFSSLFWLWHIFGCCYGCAIRSKQLCTYKMHISELMRFS